MYVYRGSIITLGLLYMKVWGFHTTERLRAAVSTSVENFDGSIYNFIWKRLNLQKTVHSLWTTKFYTFLLYRLCIFPLASPPTSLFLMILKKGNRYKSKNIFWPKRSGCRDGTLKNQPNYCRWEWYHNTCTPSLLLPILHTVNKTLHMHIRLHRPNA